MWDWTKDAHLPSDPFQKQVLLSQGSWALAKKHFVQEHHAKITSCDLKKNDTLLCGFSSGVFALFDVSTSDLSSMQSLGVSQHPLDSCALNSTGEWCCLASQTLGQVLVWEWQSETYILKQQGHYYDLNSFAYSPDGRTLASGGDDCKLKLWSVESGFSFVTFNEHTAPITSIVFAPTSNAVLSASLDGTVRAFDLVRYRNFRTLSVEKQTVQFTCLACDGDVVCAGAMDPPEIYVWSLRSGKLLDTLSGHTGPISSLSFHSPLLASSSWDHTVCVWDPYNSTAPVEIFEQNSSALSVAFRPDGKEAVSCGVEWPVVLLEH